jgi:hypothetical protein
MEANQLNSIYKHLSFLCETDHKYRGIKIKVCVN